MPDDSCKAGLSCTLTPFPLSPSLSLSPSPILPHLPSPFSVSRSSSYR